MQENYNHLTKVSFNYDSSQYLSSRISGGILDKTKHLTSELYVALYLLWAHHHNRKIKPFLMKLNEAECWMVNDGVRVLKAIMMKSMTWK